MIKLSTYERISEKLLKGQPKPKPFGKLIGKKFVTGTQSLHWTKQSRAWQLFWRIKKYKPNKIIFSASKEVEPGQNAQSRARLYDSLVQRYARAWGFGAARADAGNKVIYELSRIKSTATVGENFHDGKVKGKSRPGRVKRAGASCSGSITSLRKKSKAGGEKGKMYHWCANMKSGKKK